MPAYESDLLRPLAEFGAAPERAELASFAEGEAVFIEF